MGLIEASGSRDGAYGSFLSFQNAPLTWYQVMYLSDNLKSGNIYQDLMGYVCSRALVRHWIIREENHERPWFGAQEWLIT